MADQPAQAYGNHRRYDPWYHFVLFGLVVLNLAFSIALVWKHPGKVHAWGVVWAASFLLFFFKIRIYALQVQDRVIRLEERLRLAALLPDPLKARIGELTVRQLVGLRFASDGDVASLVEAALAENLSEDEIKKRIKSWRADWFRV